MIEFGEAGPKPEGSLHALRARNEVGSEHEDQDGRQVVLSARAKKQGLVERPQHGDEDRDRNELYAGGGRRDERRDHERRVGGVEQDVEPRAAGASDDRRPFEEG